VRIARVQHRRQGCPAAAAAAAPVEARRPARARRTPPSVPGVQTVLRTVRLTAWGRTGCSPPSGWALIAGRLRHGRGVYACCAAVGLRPVALGSAGPSSCGVKNVPCTGGVTRVFSPDTTGGLDWGCIFRLSPRPCRYGKYVSMYLGHVCLSVRPPAVRPAQTRLPAR